MPSTLRKLCDAAASGSITDVDRGCGDTNQTPLMVASVTGSSRIVRDLDLLKLEASSVLHKHLAIAKRPVEAGTDIEARIEYYEAG